ncbi:hypothetical protein JRQ81_002247, partial [Phrynocephalus forsythii]
MQKMCKFRMQVCTDSKVNEFSTPPKSFTKTHFVTFVQDESFRNLETNGEEEPGVIIAEEGEPVNITCKFHQEINRALRLNRTLRKPMEVLYVAVWEKRKKEALEYANRTEYFELNNTVTIMLQQVKVDDSDVYMCKGLMLTEGEPTETDSRSIMLAVKAASDNKSRSNSSYLWMLSALIVQSILLVAVLAFCILLPEN